MFLEATKLGGVSANCHVAPASTAGFRAVNASHTASVCVPSRVRNELRFAAAMSMRILTGCMVLLLMTSHTWAQDKSAPSPMKSSSLLTDFQVIEFRRYTIRDGEREHFAQYFESYFPEAFQQLGAVAVGQFLERGNDSPIRVVTCFSRHG